MKVLVTHDTIAPGDGSSRYLAEVMRLLAEAGHDVEVACAHLAWSLDPRVRRRPPDAKNPVDVVLGSHLPTLAAYEPLATRLVYAPLGALPWLEEPAQESELRPLEAWALQRCDALLRFTEAGVDLLEETHGLRLREKSYVAPYLHTLAALSPPPGTARARPARLLWVGRLSRTKNVSFLLEAMALLAPGNWRLEIAGEGPRRAALEEHVQRAGLCDAVLFRGWLGDEALAEAYAQAAVLLTASRVEHYSLTLMEAYAAGTPCIGLRPDFRTIYNACDEQILEGKTGLLIDSPAEMAAACTALLADEPRRAALGAAGYERLCDLVRKDAFRPALLAAVAGDAGHRIPLL
jgi:glycosyltransferase involved in cell wall biosynthesis